MESFPPNKKKIIIAVDGFSSCGKSTFAREVAARIGYIFIDTGAMYRAVTLLGLSLIHILFGCPAGEDVLIERPFDSGPGKDIVRFFG